MSQTFSPGSPFSSLTPTKKSFSRPKSAEVSREFEFTNMILLFNHGYFLGFEILAFLNSSVLRRENRCNEQTFVNDEKNAAKLRRVSAPTPCP